MPFLTKRVWTAQEHFWYEQALEKAQDKYGYLETSGYPFPSEVVEGIVEYGMKYYDHWRRCAIHPDQIIYWGDPCCLTCAEEDYWADRAAENDYA